MAFSVIEQLQSSQRFVSSSNPRCPPDGGEDALALGLDRLHVLHPGQGGLGQAALGPEGGADLLVQQLNFVWVGGKVVQEK